LDWRYWILATQSSAAAREAIRDEIKTKAHAILIDIRETMLASMTSTLVDSLKEHSTTCDLSTQDKHAHLCTSWVTKVSVPINIIIIIIIITMTFRRPSEKRKAFLAGLPQRRRSL
jgi:hypothetical protein